MRARHCSESRVSIGHWIIRADICNGVPVDDVIDLCHELGRTPLGIAGVVQVDAHAPDALRWSECWRSAWAERVGRGNEGDDERVASANSFTRSGVDDADALVDSNGAETHRVS